MYERILRFGPLLASDYEVSGLISEPYRTKQGIAERL